MTFRTRYAAVLSAFTAVVLLAGCTAAPGAGTPTSSSTPGPENVDDMNDVEGVLLDSGRMFAVITTGSSTCVPQVEEVSADGQTVTVTLVDVPGDAACTKDLVPRASLGALPDGVDPKTDITLQVTYGDLTDDVDIDGDPPATGESGLETGMSTAGWFDDGGLVLLTWGSSSCVPVVESLEGSGNAGTATFVTDDDQICTMDMGPRGTILSFGEDTVDDDAPFTLTLVGDGLDGTIRIG
ncbi:hypothetical protein [Microbacterium sp. PMB16]|uniref:hypothetical protein n=1 Tax=Microbacterium sp. PMB16 TaxID=3120157 RepID=UPI003F4BB35B